MLGKVTHLTIFVHNQDEALDFYTNKMGYRVHTDANFGDMRWLTVSPQGVDDFEIALIRAVGDAKAIVGKQSANEPLAAFYTSDCQKTYTDLKNSGVKFLSEPKKEDWGTGALFEDLYGNKFYLNQPA